MTVRTRIAPSPTGFPHVGTAYIALFNLCFAKQHGGEFILRIEDTDQLRSTPESEKMILDSLRWLGLNWSEGPDIGGPHAPYRQSERMGIYKQYALELIEKGHAFYCFATSEELDQMRIEQQARGESPRYDGRGLKHTAEEVERRLAAGEPHVIRMKVPEEGICKFNDLLRGEVEIPWAQVDMQILLKTDGLPTYHLANVVDDHLMEITHVIRGEEWLPSVPLHIALYEAFGWTAPEFAHLPLILKPVGKGKLSKRDGDKLGFPVFPLEYFNEETNEIARGYREDGYFADAFINMLALLGWNPGTEQEIFTLAQLSEAFTLERVSKSGAKFSPDKTKWFNQQYMLLKTNEELADLFQEILVKKGITKDISYVTKVVSQIKERATFVNEFWDLSDYFFETPTVYDEKAVSKNWKEDTSELMKELISVIETVSEFTSINLENTVKEWITSKEIGFGKVMQPFRLSLVGAMKGPHLFDIGEMIGKQETIDRIEKAIGKF